MLVAGDLSGCLCWLICRRSPYIGPQCCQLAGGEAGLARMKQTTTQVATLELNELCRVSYIHTHTHIHTPAHPAWFFTAHQRTRSYGRFGLSACLSSTLCHLHPKTDTITGAYTCTVQSWQWDKATLRGKEHLFSKKMSFRSVLGLFLAPDKTDR